MLIDNFEVFIKEAKEFLENVLNQTDDVSFLIKKKNLKCDYNFRGDQKILKN